MRIPRGGAPSTPARAGTRRSSVSDALAQPTVCRYANVAPEPGDLHEHPRQPDGRGDHRSSHRPAGNARRVRSDRASSLPQAGGSHGGCDRPGAALPHDLAAQIEAAASAGSQEAQEVLIALGNGEAPALQFQSYPGGTGALLQQLWGEVGGTPFRRETFEVEPWSGAVPGTEEEIAFLPAHRLAALLRERRITSVELTEIYLERLHRLNPLLLCAVTILDGRAREEAQQADAEIRAGSWRGPLHGIPWGVKDLFSARGGPTTWGSEDFQSQVIDEDAEIVARMNKGGAVLLVKLSTGRFAQGSNWFGGQTKNPWNPEEASGGSSAGPGSATAAGCVAFYHRHGDTRLNCGAVTTLWTERAPSHVRSGE